ncbi:hypothetical protein THRCLA_01614 [Thraustotheca clavata]|uniref:PX domain-containing protein n=1 Tax=Thraustotheca clavata TaxID=74557 RepID=A0A1W0A849_9STRA|nr:hypothetical protein THRCLA_01614 [Thraustotheca clavata]
MATSYTSIDLSRIAHGMELAKCRISSASVHKRKEFVGLITRDTVVYHLKVIDSQALCSYMLNWTHDHFSHLDKQFRRIALENAAFSQAISNFPCPRKLIFNKRDALVVKGMCGQLEYHLVAILKLGVQYAATSSDIQEALRDCLQSIIATTIQPLQI